MNRRNWALNRNALLAAAVLLCALATATPAAAQFCSTAADCDDGIACTIDTCSGSPLKVCRSAPNGTDCTLTVVGNSSATCSGSNSDELSCTFTNSALPTPTFGLKSVATWGLCADPDVGHDRGIHSDVTHGVNFELKVPGGYRLDVIQSWNGFMHANSSSPAGGTSDADVGPVASQWSGSGRFVPDPTPRDGVPIHHDIPTLADPGVAHVNAADIGEDKEDVDGSASFAVYDRSNGETRSHALSFRWSGHARGEEAYGSIRLGEGFWEPDQANSNDCLYPGTPSRAKIDDGHVIRVAVVPLCGNGQIDPEVGEECDTADGDPTCCTQNCTVCCGDGVANPGETCDPAIPGSSCGTICEADDFTVADWGSPKMSLVNAASWVDDPSDFFAPMLQRLRLTNNTPGARGAAWYDEATVDPSRDWSANFSYQASYAQNGGADGLSLILQRDGVSADYSSGVDDPPSANRYLAIGLDTHYNEGLDAFDENLEVHVNGTFPGPSGSPTQGLSLASANFGGCPGNLVDCVYNVYARYTAATRALVVTVTSPNHSGAVTGTWNLDLAALLGTDGDYRVGFAANTGGAGENHDVLRWAFEFQSGCGNGDTGAGEQCDAGAANGTPGSCCSATCTLKPSGTACSSDGNVCTDDVCTGASPFCLHVNNTASCDDGLFCNGDDTCSGGGCVMHGGDPCPGPDGDGNCAESCNEASNACTRADANGSSCDDGAFCNGADTCSAGSCATHAGSPCPGPDGDGDCAESCDETTRACNAADPSGAACSDGVFCNGADTCNAGSCAAHAGNPCPGPDGDADCAESCDEAAGTCGGADPDGTACRASAGECDPAESCSAGACPADERVSSGTTCTGDGDDCTLDACDDAGRCAHTSTGDTDDDTLCDAQDPCTNVGGAQDFVTKPGSKLTITKVNTQTKPNDDGIVLAGTFDLPVGKSFADIQPDADGARLLIETVDGTQRLDAAVAAGGQTGSGTRGWSRSKNGKTWTFSDRTGTPVSGIVKLVLKDASKSGAPNRVKVTVSGKSGNYPVLAADTPINATVVLGNQEDAAVGLCGETSYGAADCAFNRAGSTLTCKR